MECPVCLETYRTPLLLPGCGHTICRPCAEIMVTPDNYLRCPECRLVYQLRRGVASLPKNIALQRTIDETSSATPAPSTEPRCGDHPADAAALYCHTCSRHICLKCYFSAGTLPRGIRRTGPQHQGHDVKTAEDVMAKEKRLLEEANKSVVEKIDTEEKYIKSLEETEEQLKKILTEKLAEIDKRKEELIANVKQTAGKLKFTLKGTVARDEEQVDQALMAARERLGVMQAVQEEAAKVVSQLQTPAKAAQLPIQSLMEARCGLEQVEAGDSEPPPHEDFLRVRAFSTQLDACLHDHRRALSYQTETPREPSIVESECIISDSAAFMSLKYPETVRTDRLVVTYRQALFKGLSEEPWESSDTNSLSNGKAWLCLRGLQSSTMYKAKVTAMNEWGESECSREVWFRTADRDAEIRTT